MMTWKRGGRLVTTVAWVRAAESEKVVFVYQP